jgi:localization factor PodJL
VVAAFGASRALAPKGGERSIRGDVPRDILLVDAMKSNAPWSVKGIERDARETAKAAAQREGMTVGEWLNQTIYSAGDPDAPVTEGDIEGLRARDLAAAIEHLSKRIAIAETKSASAVDNLARSLGGAVERLQRLERAEPGEGSDAELAARVKTLEEKGADRQRIEALRALERAVGQIAVQFTNAQQSTVARLDATEKQLQLIAERVTGENDGETVSANAVREAIEGMAERVARAEKIAAEASQLKAEAGESVDADFIHKTGLRLRILGDEIKRGGDQMRTLETTITRMSQQIDAAEKRSAEGVQKVAETIADLRSQFSSAETGDQATARAEIEAAVSEIAQRTEDRIETLQQSFDDMVRRLEGATGDAQAPVADQRARRQDDFDDQPDEPAAAAFAAAPLPTAKSGALDDIDSDLDDAFAALELEDPIPTPAAASAPAPVARPKAPASQADQDDDDFGFDAEDETERAAEDASETEDVLAEIREAFGIDAPEETLDETEEPAAHGDESDASLDELIESEAELPPIADEAPARSSENPSEQADYLKAARRAAREAAAKAAEEAQTPSKKKLTPKQRAILAARIKRRKQEAEQEKAAAAPFEATPLAADRDDGDAPDQGSIKARVSALLAKIKSRAPGQDAKQPKEPKAATLDAPIDDLAEQDANPSLLSGATAALKKFNLTPTGGVLGLGVAIVLLLAALFFLTKDILGRGKTPAAAAPQAVTQSVEPPATGATQTSVDNERIEPAATAGDDATIRPRELYLDNIAALKSATTDAEARIALKHIEEAAALGHPPAQLQIGELYKLGQLYDRDLGMARQWFERAANGGNVLAMHRLGVMAARGEGGPVDPAASIAWFEKAASFGLVDSQYNLGATYHPTPEGAGNGIQDRAKAYFWYSIAAKNGDAQAGEMAAGLAGSMPAAERSAKDAEVAAWAPKTPDPLANELAPAN